MDFIEKGKEIRNSAKQIVLNYMINIPHNFDLTQANIFNTLDFGWGNQKNATSTNQQYWIVALLKQLEEEGFIQQDEFTLYWTTTEKSKLLKNINNCKINTIESLKKEVSLLKDEAIELVLTYMKECKNDPKNICGFQQSYIFNQCGFDFGNYDRAESTKQQFWVIGLLRRLEKENKVYRGERKRWKLYSEKKDEETTEDKFRLELKEIFQTKEVKEAFVNILKGLSFTHNNANTFLLGMHQLCLLYTIKKNLSVNVRDILINMLSIEDEKQYSCIKASENYKDILNNIFCQLRYPENTDLNLFDYKKAKATLDDFDNISKSLSSYDYHPFQLRLALLVLNEVYTATSFHLKNDNICEKVKKDISTFNKDLNLIISKYACPTLDSYINFDL